MVYIQHSNIRESLRVLYEHLLPRTLRTLLISPYSPYTLNTPNIPIVSIKLNTSNTSDIFVSLKKLILTRWNVWGGKRIEQIERVESLRVLYESNTRGYLEWVRG